MNKKRIVILLLLTHLAICGQAQRRYYLKLAAGPKLNIWHNDNNTTLYAQDPIYRADEEIKTTTFAELMLGIPIATYAHLETGIVKNDFQYGRSLVSRDKYGKILQIPVPDLKFTTWQMPVRLRTSINLLNKRIFLLTHIGFSDVLRILNNSSQRTTFSSEHTFYNDGYSGVVADMQGLATMEISATSSYQTHPFYIELGGGIEWFVTKNISASVVANYNISNNGRELYTTYTDIDVYPIYKGYHSQTQNALAVNLLFGVHYYFKNNIASLFKPFDSI
jgi:hypothetical protein